jgi:hypothetical protein
MNAREKISKLESLLARIKQRAEMPRAVVVAAAPIASAHTPMAMPTVPPTAEAHALKADEADIRTPPPPPPVQPIAVEVLESRTQVVAQETSVVELDESDMVPSSVQPPPVVAEEAPPPSSKRPIPMEAIAEAQQHEPPPPPPPESGKLVAAAPAEVPAFDDDFTGVREASNLLPPLEANEPPIEVMTVEPPKPPPPPHEMEASLSPPAAAEPTRRISDVAPAPVAAAQEAIVPEKTAASLPQATPVAVVGASSTFKPKTFGELIDATLGL